LKAPRSDSLLFFFSPPPSRSHLMSKWMGSRGFCSLHGRSSSHKLAGYTCNDNGHFCLSCSKRCLRYSVWANRKNAAACFLTPLRNREETANIQAFWDVKRCALVITSTATRTSFSLGNSGRKRKHSVFH
jgi:hypothetical protein